MNKKSTIGMVLLVAMVLTKALLPDFNASSEDLSVRNDSAELSTKEIVDLRTTHTENLFFSPRTNFVASVISTPRIADFRVININDAAHVEMAYSDNDLLAEANQPESTDTEPIPMDYVSNTGYGLWRTSTAKMTSKSDREGKVPLDNGNTITDNMSRLFPRIP